MSLERDEGEYAYAGQLMLQGVPPYRLAYNMKFPGTYMAYAVIMSIFGQTVVGIHLGLLLVNVATVALIFFLGRLLFDEIAGLAAGATYALLSVTPNVLGFAGHATHFVVFFVVGGTLLLVAAVNSRPRVLVCGILFGIAVMMKQPAAAFVGFAVVYLIWGSLEKLRERVARAGIFLGGAILPLVVTLLWLGLSGVFGAFWFWCVKYASAYGTLVPLSTGVQLFTGNTMAAIGEWWPVWSIAAIGLVGLCIFRGGRSLGVISGLAVCGFAAAAAGLYFREHYYILLLPALALGVGAAVFLAGRFRFGALIAICVFAIALAFPLSSQWQFFFEQPLDVASRIAYGLNPFPEAVRIGDFLRERSRPGETIAVLGSEPEIYFYAHRHSATGYIYTYGLGERHSFAERMQREMVHEIESARPDYIVLVSLPSSWIMVPDSDPFIFDWFDEYSARELKPIGLVNILSEWEVEYYLPYDSEPLKPAPHRIVIYARKS